jgi:hypothetical protein
MIILDEDPVAQRGAVIRASAEEDGPFLKGAQAGGRFSRIQDADRASVNCMAILARQGGDTGEVLKKVQGDPFRREDGSAIAFDLEETVSSLRQVSIPVVHEENKRGIDGAKHLNSRGESGDHQGLLGDDAGACWNRSRKEDGGCDVAMREVFLERQPNGAADVGNRSLDHQLGS